MVIKVTTFKIMKFSRLRNYRLYQLNVASLNLSSTIEEMSCLMTKPTKWHVHPAKTQISLGIRPVWSESSLSAWRNTGSLATHWRTTKTLVRRGGSESSLLLVFVMRRLKLYTVEDGRRWMHFRHVLQRVVDSDNFAKIFLFSHCVVRLQYQDWTWSI